MTVSRAIHLPFICSFPLTRYIGSRDRAAEDALLVPGADSPGPRRALCSPLGAEGHQVFLPLQAGHSPPDWTLARRGRGGRRQ
jgi:hypothetical protein